MGFPRPTEEAALDPWAETVRLQEQRANMEAKARIQRRATVIAGLGWGAALLLVAAVILGVSWLIYLNVGNAREDTIRQTEARRELVQQCASIPDEVERQLCYIAAAIDLGQDGRSE